MIKFEQQLDEKPPKNKIKAEQQYRRLVALGRIHKEIINEMSSPIDATNRFINLALQNISEDSQSRQFLLESKHGLRKTSTLLKKLNDYAKKIEKEIREISRKTEQGARSNT